MPISVEIGILTNMVPFLGCLRVLLLHGVKKMTSKVCDLMGGEGVSHDLAKSEFYIIKTVFLL